MRNVDRTDREHVILLGRATNMRARRMRSYIDYWKARLHLETLTNEHGEVLLTRIQVLRVIAMANNIARGSSPEDQKKYKLKKYQRWMSSDNLSYYYNDYSTLLKLIENNNIISFEFRGLVRVATVNPEYIIEDGYDLEIDDVDYKELTIFSSKMSKSGVRHSANSGISINVDRVTFESEVRQHWINKGKIKSEEQIIADLNCQWNRIESINRTGSINPKKTRRGRCSSWYTELSSPVNKYVLIDGEQTVDMDQHATYFTLMPVVLKNRTPIEEQTTEFFVELDKLKYMIKNEPNIYKYISTSMNVEVKDIKVETNKFFCEPNSSRTYTQHLFSFFDKEFPLLNRAMLVLRTKKGPYSDFNRIESSIFSGASRILNNKGIKSITKYDSIVVKLKDLDKAKEVLNECFIKAGVSNRLKETKGMVPEIIENRDKKLEEGAGSRTERECQGTDDALPLLFDFSGTNSGTKPKKTVDRPTFIRQDSRGRFICKVKGTPFAQRSQESLEEFQNRVFDATGTRPMKKEDNND